MKGTKPHMRPERAPLGILPAPDWLADDARAEWDRIMPILAERRILTDADLGGVENYCIAIGTVRLMERQLQREGHVLVTEGGAVKRHPALAVQSDAMTRARLLAAEMGLTPVSRSRPAIRDDDGDDDDLVS